MISYMEWYLSTLSFNITTTTTTNFPPPPPPQIAKLAWTFPYLASRRRARNGELTLYVQAENTELLPSVDSNGPRTPRAPCFNQESTGPGDEAKHLISKPSRISREPGSPWPLKHFKLYLLLFFVVSYNLN